MFYNPYGAYGSNNSNPIFINFSFDDNMVECIIEHYIGTALVKRELHRFYPEQAKQWFYACIRNMVGQSPRGIKLIWFDYIYDQIENAQKKIENSAEAWNFHRDDWKWDE